MQTFLKHISPYYDILKQGKFVFKNGRIYEGIFKDDHIDEYPDFEMDGMNTPDMTNIKTRTPLPSGQYYDIETNRLFNLINQYSK